jgi:hypothetical protein
VHPLHVSLNPKEKTITTRTPTRDIYHSHNTPSLSMSSIVEEMKNPTLMLESKEQKNILFHIAHIEGLPTRPGWTPLAGTYLSVENLETKEFLDTEHKKITPGQTKWCENLPLLQVTDSAHVRFAINHQGLLNKRSVLGATDTFTIQDLVRMQQAADHGMDKRESLFVFLNFLLLILHLCLKSSSCS